MTQHRLSLDSIADAAQSIDPVFRNTPQYDCEPLSRALGASLTLKLEVANPIRSFKGRGADHFLAAVEARGDERPLICASAGNFGQAMAFACRKRGRPMIVYAATTANPLKIEQMRGLGAEVRLEGDDFDAAKAAARAQAADVGGWFVEDGKEPEISEGAGSIAVELLVRGDSFDAVLVPLGNGALLTGVARWFKQAAPETQVIGVSAAGADAMEKSWRADAVISNPTAATIADGVAVREPVPEAVTDMRGVVDDVLLVEDAATRAAMKMLFDHAGLLIEPSGALGVAAVDVFRDRFKGRRLATILCGSNISGALAAELATG